MPSGRFSTPKHSKLNCKTSKMKHYAITGRITGDDEDSLFTITAENEQIAIETFRNELVKAAGYANRGRLHQAGNGSRSVSDRTTRACTSITLSNRTLRFWLGSTHTIKTMEFIRTEQVDSPRDGRREKMGRMVAPFVSVTKAITATLKHGKATLTCDIQRARLLLAAPIARVRSGSLNTREALVRWDHGAPRQSASISPPKFNQAQPGRSAG